MGIFSKRTPATAPTPPLSPITGSGRALAVPAGNSFTPHTPSKPIPFSTHRNLTAAAQIVDISTAEGRASYTKRRSSAQGWQDEAWIYVNEIGEISYAFGYVANAVSRIKLYAGSIEDPTAPPKSVDHDSQIGQAANDILARLSSAYGGIPGFLRDLTLNLEISGEALLVQRPANPFAVPPVPESWDIRSVDEVQLSSEGQFVITEREDGDRTSQIVLPKHAYVARIWVPSPRFSGDATSSMRPVLSLCAELLLLNKTFRAVERSRLNSGLLYLPDGLSVAASPDADVFDDETMDEGYDQEPGSIPMPNVAFDAGEQADTDDFEEALLEAMTTPIADEESASAVVPLIVRGPSELGDKIRLIQFERTFDPTLSARAEHVLDRILQGLNVPKEVTKGLSGLKFSASEMVDVQLNANHVEPMALVIVDALTTVYLRPMLRAMGFPEDEVRKVVIWYDAFEVTRRPNRAEDADKGYSNNLISGASWRKAHQFSDDDAPTSTEVAFRMLQDRGPITPELAEALLSVVAPDIMAAVREAAQSASPETAIPSEIEDILGGEVETPDTLDSDVAETNENTPAPTPTPSAPAPAQAPAVDRVIGEEELI